MSLAKHKVQQMRKSAKRFFLLNVPRDPEPKMFYRIDAIESKEPRSDGSSAIRPALDSEF